MEGASEAIGSPAESKRGFRGGKCSALPTDLSHLLRGGKLAQAMRPSPLGWSFSLFHKISMKKTWLPFAFFRRKSLEVRESKGVLAVTAVLTSARPAIRSIQSLLLEQGDSGSFPEAPEQGGSLTGTNQYKPLFLMRLRLRKPHPSACRAETPMERGAECLLAQEELQC